MIHLHTSKVFSDDLAKANCVLSSSANGSAWHWYAHRITLMRKKCVIVMEEASRYALFFVGLKKKDCNPPQSKTNERLMAVLEQKSSPVFCSQGLDRSVQAHIPQVADELESLVCYRFERLP